jgi:hypothetical protein
MYKESPKFFKNHAEMCDFVLQNKLKFDSNILKNIVNQAATASEVEVENASGETIALIGKTELTLVLEGSADDAATNGIVYDITYKDQDGETKSVSITGTATMKSVPLAIGSDVYEVTSLTASAAQAVVTITAKVAGGATYATLSVNTTAATASQLFGVGSVYIAQKTDQVATDGGLVNVMEYVTPWGKIKSAMVLLNAVDTTTEGRWIVAENGDSTGLYVNDFYRKRFIGCVGQVAADEILLSDSGQSNIYGVIPVAKAVAEFNRYICPKDYTAYLTEIEISSSIATNIDTYVTIEYISTLYDGNFTFIHKIAIPNNGVIKKTLMFDIKPLSEIVFKLKGNVNDVSVKTNIVEFTKL